MGKILDVQICGNCTKGAKWVATGYVCPVWGKNKEKTFGYRQGACFFGNMVGFAKKQLQGEKARVGQQKQKKKK